MTTLMIDATVPNWIGSGVRVSKGDVVDIRAFGAIRYYGGGAEDIPPGGTGRLPDTGYYVSERHPAYALLGLVSWGPPTAVDAEMVHNRDQSLPMFLVGDYVRYTSPADGYLYFVVNDSMFKDDAGRFQVIIGSEPALRCDGIEAVQSVQDRAQSVPPIRGKQTCATARSTSGPTTTGCSSTSASTATGSTTR